MLPLKIFQKGVCGKWGQLRLTIIYTYCEESIVNDVLRVTIFVCVVCVCLRVCCVCVILEYLADFNIYIIV